MKIVRIVLFLLILMILLFSWGLMGGDIKHWYLILLVAFIFENISYERISKALHIKNDTIKQNTGDINVFVLLWLLFLGIGVTGFIFSLVDLNWIMLVMWFVIIVFIVYKLSKYFD